MNTCIEDVMTPLCKLLLSYDNSDWKPVSNSMRNSYNVVSKFHLAEKKLPLTVRLFYLETKNILIRCI